MRRLTLLLSAGIAAVAPIVLAQSTGPYKVLKTAKVGGEGGTDYIFADTVGRRLYITRGATQAQPATDTRPEVPAFEKRSDDLRSRHARTGGRDSWCWRQRRDRVPEDRAWLHQRPSPALDVRRQDDEVDQDDRSAGRDSARTASTATLLTIASTSAAIRRRA